MFILKSDIYIIQINDNQEFVSESLTANTNARKAPIIIYYSARNTSK